MLYHGDLFTVLPTLAAASIEACVTDPPYGIGFMGREWDTFKPGESRASKGLHANQRIGSANPNLRGRRRAPAVSPSQIEYDYTATGLLGFQQWTAQWAAEVYRVLKPGAYLVVCGAPRSHHRMMCGLEDAGFVVRDCFAWLFGSGFPKNKNLGQGRGTALKPAHEPIALAWKPFKGTISANVEKFGTGALNIDVCRIEGEPWTRDTMHKDDFSGGKFHAKRDAETYDCDPQVGNDLGRWPANVLLDEEAAVLLDEMTEGQVHDAGAARDNFCDTGASSWYTKQGGGNVNGMRFGDVGGASRFYYVAKPSREERDYGCDDLPQRSGGDACEDRAEGSAGLNNPRAGAGRTGGARNIHPTVKPVELMRWLVKLVTPLGGTVLDPFTGSGTTGMACRYEQRQFIGIEREAEYVQIAERRIAAVAPLFGQVPA